MPQAGRTGPGRDPAGVASAVSPILAGAAAALDASDVRWALLRGALGDDAGDVDVLVHPADRGTAEAVLAAQGFARWPSWGRATHRFHLAYDVGTDTWVKVDLVTEVAFGPFGELATDAGPAVLARRVPGGDAPALAPDDGFWALLLHCLLDRGTVPPRHRDALAHLAAAGEVLGGALLDTLDPVLPGDEAAELVRLAAAADVSALEAAAGPLRDRWLRADRAAHRRLRRGRVARRLAAVPVVLGRRGVSVALLGPDGAGKSTLAAALVATPALRGRSVYAGLYGAAAPRPSLPVPGLRLGARLAHLWRLRLRAAAWRARGRVVVFDRHGLDAAAAPARPRGGPARRARRRLLAAALPSPDVLVVLDAPAEVLLARKGEHDVPTLEAQRARYRALADRPGAAVVDASRDPEAVRRDVTSLVWRRWSGRWSA